MLCLECQFFVVLEKTELLTAQPTSPANDSIINSNIPTVDESPFEHAVLESSFSDRDPNIASDSEGVSQPKITTYTIAAD